MTGAITIRPTLKQREAKRIVDTHTITVYGGGIRGGKSYFLFFTIFTYCFKYAKSRWLVLRESMPTMKRNLFPTFQNILDMGFAPYVKEWNQGTQVVTFNNGSQILFMEEGYERDKELNRFRGLEINGAGIDEINEIQQATFFKIIERSGSWTKAGNVPIKIIATCNPSSNWVRELVYERWRNNDLPSDWAFIPAKITDNPYITQEYLDNLKRNLPETEYAKFVEGDWDVQSIGTLFANADLQRFALNDFKEQGRLAILGYIDVADEGTDAFCFVLGKIFMNKIYITDVVFTEDNVDITLPLTVELIKRQAKHDDEKDKTIVTSDIDYVRVETNNQGSIFIKMLRQQVRPDRILPCTNSSNKHTRILLTYDFVKRYVLFLNEKDYKRNSEYDKFMKQLLSYTKDGTSKHDDAPDALSGLCIFAQSFLPHLFK